MLYNYKNIFFYLIVEEMIHTHIHIKDAHSDEQNTENIHEKSFCRFETLKTFMFLIFAGSFQKFRDKINKFIEK
jgi:hypothetical protein